MRERQRAEIVRNLLAERGFLSIADIMAATGASAASARRDAVRLAVPAATLSVLGFETIMGSFFLSVLGLSRR